MANSHPRRLLVPMGAAQATGWRCCQFCARARATLEPLFLFQRRASRYFVVYEVHFSTASRKSLNDKVSIILFRLPWSPRAAACGQAARFEVGLERAGAVPSLCSSCGLALRVLPSTRFLRGKGFPIRHNFPFLASLVEWAARLYEAPALGTFAHRSQQCPDRRY